MTAPRTMTAPADRLWNARYIKVMAANFSMFFAFYLLTPLLPMYMTQEFGATKDVIGIILAGYSATALLVRPFSGYLVDTFPRKRVLMVCFWAFVLLFGGYILAGTMLWFALVRVLHGGPFGALTVVNTTVAIDVLPASRRNEGLALYGVGNNLAMAIAPTLAITLYHYADSFQLLFWLATFVAAIGLALDQSLRLPQRECAPPPKSLSLDRFFLIPGWALGLNLVLNGFCIGVYNYYLAIYSHEVRGITSGAGIFFSLMAIGLITSRIVGRRSMRMGLLSQSAVRGLLISSVGFTLFIAVPATWSYYAAALTVGIGNGMMWPAFQNMMLSLGTHMQRGTANSTTFTSWDTGIGLGILLGGVISEHAGYTATFWTVAAAQIAATLMFILFTRGYFERRRLR